MKKLTMSTSPSLSPPQSLSLPRHLPLLSPLYLFLTLLSLQISPSLSSDPCAAVFSQQKANSTSFVTAAAARTCLESFPYDKKVAAATLRTVSLTLSGFWTYLDIAKNAPDPRLPSKVDVLAELARIGNRTYPNDMAFHRAVYDVMRKANDGHLVYFPYCYAVNSALPFSLMTYFEGETRVIKIAPASFRDAIIVNGKPVPKYYYATVNEINGVSAISYLMNLADKKTGVYKDLGARFNSLFISRYLTSEEYYYFGGFASRNFPPKEDFVTMNLTRIGSKKSETVKVPWFTEFETGYTDSKKYYSTFCNNSFYNKTWESEPISMLQNYPTPQKINVVQNPESRRTSKKEVEKLKPRLLNSGSTETWVLPDNKTGVMIVPAFYPSPIYSEDMIDEFFTGFFLLKRLGINRLIIDLQDNPGGMVSLSDKFVETLFPSLKNGTYNIEFRATSIIQKMVKKAISLNKTYSEFSPAGYQTLNSVPFADPKDFFFPIVSKTFGGVKGNYSSLAKLRGLTLPSDMDPNVLPLFEPKNILILTNGKCFSACANFVYRMAEFAYVRSISVGGFKGVQMAVASGTGGFVSYLDSIIYRDAHALGLLKDKDVPRELPLRVSLSFPLCQCYFRNNSEIPADYVFKPATYQLQYTKDTVLDKGALWTQVATYF